MLRGAFTTGALKAAGSLGLALGARRREPDYDALLLAAAVLVLATNLFNLLDLRPGRSVKAFVLLGAALTHRRGDAEPLLDARPVRRPARSSPASSTCASGRCSGDTGSNLTGAVAGLWLVLALGTTGCDRARVVLALITVYGEFRSISALVERTPGFAT